MSTVDPILSCRELIKTFPSGDHGAAHHQRPQNAPEQQPVLVGRRHPEPGQDQGNDEDVVQAEGLLDDIAGEELQGGGRPVQTSRPADAEPVLVVHDVDQGVEGQGEDGLFAMVDELTKKIKASFKLTAGEISSDMDQEVIEGEVGGAADHDIRRITDQGGDEKLHHAFVNDSYWFLFPLMILGDGSTVADGGTRKVPGFDSLGERTAVDSVTAYWPSGVRTVHRSLEIDRYHRLEEE